MSAGGEWLKVCGVDDIPVAGARVVRVPGRADIALFRTLDDRVFALHDRCPHKGGPLSQGIVHGARVTCPLHAWVIELATGSALEPDVGMVACIRVRSEAGEVFLHREDLRRDALRAQLIADAACAPA
ncbi:MAG: nitrite reductase small subunit NirD [Gammaproteobacteria bacterium]|nr:MAG: nitrite reductase small subunit NirD [Gammaproteobacteria bacterium]